MVWTVATFCLVSHLVAPHPFSGNTAILTRFSKAANRSTKVPRSRFATAAGSSWSILMVAKPNCTTSKRMKARPPIFSCNSQNVPPRLAGQISKWADDLGFAFDNKAPLTAPLSQRSRFSPATNSFDL